MNKIKKEKFQYRILFSVPGRIRLQAEGLKLNNNLADFLEGYLYHLEEIISVKASMKTGNIVITYNSSVINENAILSYIRTIHYRNLEDSGVQPRSQGFLLTEEKSLIKRFSLVSVTASLLASLISLKRAAAVLVIGFPAMIPVITYYSLNNTLLYLKKRDGIIINNIKAVRLTQNIKRILFHPDIIFMEKTPESMNYMSGIQIESMIANGELRDPVKTEMRELVKNLRRAGYNSLYVFDERKKDGRLEYARISLGISPVPKKKRYNTVIIPQGVKYTKPDVLTIVTGTNHNSGGGIRDNNIYCKDLSEIPLLVRNCFRSHEYLIKSQTAALSVAAFGIMLAFTGYMAIFTSLLFYCINLLGNLVYLRHAILNLTEELPYGEQRKYDSA